MKNIALKPFCCLFLILTNEKNSFIIESAKELTVTVSALLLFILKEVNNYAGYTDRRYAAS